MNTKKTIAGIVAGASLVVGGGALTDAQINPYTTVGTKLEIASQSVLKQGGTEKVAMDTLSPKVTLSKWNSEVAMGVKYQGITAAGNRPLFSKNVEWKQNVQTMQAVPQADGGVEINVILDSKPASNVFNFVIDGAENLDFFYQPSLTPQEIAKGSIRPENAIGSYAVYYKNHAGHIEGKTNYATGKAYHIYRPLVTDAGGNKVWGDMLYNLGVLSITVPQSFLDGASYPVVVDPVFGYGAVGVSSSLLGVGDRTRAHRVASNQYLAGTSNTITAISSYGNCAVAGCTIGMAIYTVSGVTPQTLTGSEVRISPSTSVGWSTSTASINLTGGTTYTTAQGNALTQDYTYFYDSVGAGMSLETTVGGPPPATWTEFAQLGESESYYATYASTTAAINPSVPNKVINNAVINNAKI